MRDSRMLSDCLVDNNAESMRSATRRRGRALALSVVIEGGLIGAMLIWPILMPGVLPARYRLIPVAPYHGGGSQAPTHSAAQHPPRPSIETYPITFRPITSAPIQALRNENYDEGGDGPPSIGSGPGNGLGNGPDIPGGLGNRPWTDTVPEVKPPAQPKSVQKSEGVQAALLDRRVEPVYPQSAILMHMSGTVRLKATIATDGSVIHLEVLSGNPLLAQSALAAVRQWYYKPTLLSGQAVEVETFITVNFVLER